MSGDKGKEPPAARHTTTPRVICSALMGSEMLRAAFAEAAEQRALQMGLTTPLRPAATFQPSLNARGRHSSASVDTQHLERAVLDRVVLEVRHHLLQIRAALSADRHARRALALVYIQQHPPPASKARESQSQPGHPR